MVGAVHYRYLPCCCRCCTNAKTVAEYEGCENVFTAAKAAGVQGFKMEEKEEGEITQKQQILCPFRLKPRLVVPQTARQAAKAAGEEVWATHWNGVEWLTAAPEEEAEELAEEERQQMWKDFADPSQLKQLQRGHAVAGSLDKGDMFVVKLKGRTNGIYARETTGWCVYQVTEPMKKLSQAEVLENAGAHIEHQLLEGEEVVTGRPLVCCDISPEGERIYQYEMAAGHRGAGAAGGADVEGEQTFSAHLIYTEVLLQEAARQSTREGPRRQGVGASHERLKLWVMSTEMQRTIDKIREHVNNKDWSRAQELALDTLEHD